MAEQTIEHRLTKLETVAENQVEILRRQTATIDQIVAAVSNIDRLNDKIDAVAAQIKALETEIDQFRDRIDNLLGAQSARLDVLDRRVSHLETHEKRITLIDDHEKRITHMETVLYLARWGGAVAWILTGALGAMLGYLIDHWHLLSR